MAVLGSGAQRSTNLARTKEQGQTEVPTCIEPLSCWIERRASRIGSSITGESVNFMLCSLSIVPLLSLSLPQTL